jgi:hypothetical protein
MLFHCQHVLLSEADLFVLPLRKHLHRQLLSLGTTRWWEVHHYSNVLATTMLLHACATCASEHYTQWRRNENAAVNPTRAHASFMQIVILQLHMLNTVGTIILYGTQSFGWRDHESCILGTRGILTTITLIMAVSYILPFRMASGHRRAIDNEQREGDRVQWADKQSDICMSSATQLNGTPPCISGSLIL